MTKEWEEVLRAAKTLSRPEKEGLVHAIERDISPVSPELCTERASPDRWREDARIFRTTRPSPR